MNDPARVYELVVLKDNFAVCRFPPGALVPGWVDSGGFWTVTRTADELSIVCEERHVPSGVQAEKGFSCLKVVGPLDFSVVDYLLVRQTHLPDAIDALRESGHVVQF